MNITGGIKIDDTAADLAIILFMLSSDQNIPLDTNICFAAEIGLSGELRAVTRIEERALEAEEKLGYKQIIISKHCKISKKDFNISIKPCGKVEEVFSLLF